MVTTHHWPPCGQRTTDQSSLAVSLQTIPYPLNGPPFKSMSSQFGGKNVMYVKDLTEIHIHNTD